MYYARYVKHSENLLALQRNATIAIVLVKFETNLRMYVGVTNYLLPV